MPERLAGLLLPVFSMRRAGDLGIGDTAALKEWIDLAADHGVGLLQLLPINEMGADDSPYNAISSVALEPLYLALDEVPGVRMEVIAAVGDGTGGTVDYPQVRGRKRGLLDQAWTDWGKAEAELVAEFIGFCEQEAGWLADYCVFRSLVERAGTEHWESWPEAWQEPEGARRAAAEEPERPRFFAWLQWLCFRQWRGVRAHADRRGVKLMGDIPIGVSRSSADVFFGRGDFDLEWCGGAPPETMFKHDRFIQKWGQNWGIPLYRWDRMKAAGFPWWRQRVGKLTDVFHVFRIDHVLGFYRIYSFPWRPERNGEFLELDPEEAAERTGGVLPGWSPRPDDTLKNQAANRADGDGRLKMVLEAAGAAEVVGEDLGCVPGYVRPHLAALGVAGFRIPHWEQDVAGQVVRGEDFPECSFATFATHDHDPIPAMWEDLRTRAADLELDEDERGDAARMLRMMADFGGLDAEREFDDEVLWGLIDALFASRSRHAAILIQDLFGMGERINQPGTVGPQNWTVRLPWDAAEARANPAWKRLRESIEASGRGTG